MPSRDWPWAVPAALGLLLILLAIGLRTLERPAEFTIGTADIRAMEGYAFAVDLKRRLAWPWQPLSDNPYNTHRSTLLLFEDGVRIGQPHQPYESVQRDGSGAYLHWGNSLIFSTPDQSDPRSNGRTYTVEVGAGISYRLLRRIADAGGLMVLGALGAVLWLQRRQLGTWLGALGRHLMARKTDYLLAALIPATVAALVGSNLPPLWNGSDSVIWLLWQLTWIPHHPPIYPAFMALFNNLFGTAAEILAATLVVQQLALVLATAYVASACRGTWQILLVSALVSLGAGLQLYAHGLFTEGLANPWLLFFLGAVLRLHRDGWTPGVATALGVALLAASLTRHALIVLGVIPVAYVTLRVMLSKRSEIRLSAIVHVVAVVLAVGVANTVVTQYVSLILDAQNTSILGRAGVYRIQGAYALVPSAERAEWLRVLTERTDDPGVREALPLMALTDNPWTGPRDAIVANPKLLGQRPDALMNAGFKAFAYWLNPYGLEQWGTELRRAVLGSGALGYCPGQVTCMLEASAHSIEVVFPADGRNLAALDGTGAELLTSAPEYRRLAGLAVTQTLDALLPLAPGARGLLLGGSLLLALVAIALGRSAADSTLLAGLWLGGASYAVALTFVTVVLPRYLAPIDVLVWLSNALALVAIAEWARSRFGVAGGQPSKQGED